VSELNRLLYTRIHFVKVTLHFQLDLIQNNFRKRLAQKCMDGLTFVSTVTNFLVLCEFKDLFLNTKNVQCVNSESACL
jgi:hypothetical protein